MNYKLFNLYEVLYLDDQLVIYHVKEKRYIKPYKKQGKLYWTLYNRGFFDYSEYEILKELKENT